MRVCVEIPPCSFARVIFFLVRSELVKESLMKEEAFSLEMIIVLLFIVIIVEFYPLLIEVLFVLSDIRIGIVILPEIKPAFRRGAPKLKESD